MIFIKDQTKNYRTSVLTVDRWSGTRRPMSWKYYFPCTNCAWPTATSRARIMGSLGWWLITLDFTAWRWPLSVIWPGPAASPYRYKYRKYRVFSHPPFRPPFFLLYSTSLPFFFHPLFCCFPLSQLFWAHDTPSSLAAVTTKNDATSHEKKKNNNNK